MIASTDGFIVTGSFEQFIGVHVHRPPWFSQVLCDNQHFCGKTDLQVPHLDANFEKFSGASSIDLLYSFSPLRQVEDDPVLRHIPYFGEEDKEEFDYRNFYDSTTLLNDSYFEGTSNGVLFSYFLTVFLRTIQAQDHSWADQVLFTPLE